MKPIRIVLSPTRSRPLNILLGLAALLAAVLLLLALATYSPADPSFNTATEALPGSALHNWVGRLGAWSSDLLLQAAGLSVFLLPLWVAGLGWSWMRSRPAGSPWLRLLGALLSLSFLPTLLALAHWKWLWRGAVPLEGVLGRLIAPLLVTYLNVQGSWVVAAALAAVGLYFSCSNFLWTVKEWLSEHWIVAQSLHDRWSNWREDRAEARELRRAEREAAEASLRRPAPVSGYAPGVPAPAAASEPEGARPGRLSSLFARRKTAPEAESPEDVPAFQRAPLELDPEEQGRKSLPKKNIWERSDEAAPAPRAPVAEAEIPVAPRIAAREERLAPAPTPAYAPVAPRAPEPHLTPRLEPRFEPRPDSRLDSRSEPRPAPSPAPRAPELAINQRADADLRTATVAPRHVSGFKLPPSTLLSAASAPQAVREDRLREEAKILEEKCAEFDVRGKVVQINPGPMVTTYEFKPEAGVKYSRVTGLADDLCLAMRAESILIERMAGKSTVGIQVPNHDRETIHLREVIESETFIKAKSRLTMAMGKDINGRIVTADLGSMPHVLIAGSTGSGKSVAINGMIMSLLYRTTPEQVRLILVDPKRVELGMYDGVPHLFTPIITEPKLAANALRNAVREMERRYKLLAAKSVRTIDQYNKLFEASAPRSLFDDETQEEEPLPYIVIIIDELADLMMLDRANVEESITRLAQMARAVGIHLILATQRPSVDVITGLIKANVPTRISFRLTSKVDSRTILDTNGAEALLGRGDMLFLPPGTSRLQRLHAPFVSEKETAAVVEFWKAQGEASYAEGFLESPHEERAAVEGAGGEQDNDPLFDDAVRLVFEFGKASTSLLQRRLRIGYGRAAHLIDLMEADGLIGPSDGSRPRELLKSPGWLHEVPAMEE